MPDFLKVWARSPRWFVITAAAGVTLALGVVDAITGYEVTLAIFYVIPVLAAAWAAGRRWGSAVAFLAAATMAAADLWGRHPYSHPLVAAWDALVRFGFFFLIAWAFGAARNSWARERTAARRDALTGVANRKGFYEAARLELARSRRYNHPLSVVLFDADGFKAANDRWGHAAGDRLLRLAAATLTRNVRGHDVVARLGGDEFAVLMPEAPGDAAAEMAVRLQAALRRVMARRRWPVTFSVGVAGFAVAPAAVDELLRRADELLYHAQGAGKDRLAFASATGELFVGGPGEGA
jgi:diguanylate cyclase (GGDEF)-like protein